jgi:REP element-mobilizing transposase RayT
MNAYNPQIHNRKSIRLKGYDYTRPGMYFITICVQNRKCLFGQITNGTYFPTPAGKMIEKWYYQLEHKFPDIKCHEMVVMPNHFHCIIENTGDGRAGDGATNVGADPRVGPGENDPDHKNGGNADPVGGEGEHVGSPHPTDPPHPTDSPLPRVVQWFKTMTTNEYIRGVKSDSWPRFDGKLWQRDYWDRIIRDEKAYRKISTYIVNNPSKWEEDSLRAGDDIDS